MNIVPIERACTKCEHGVIVSAGGDDARNARATACRCAVDCETCGRTGYVFRQEHYGLVSELCPDCEPLRARIARYNAAGVPRRYTASTVSNYIPISPSQHAAVAWFSEHRDTWKPGDRALLLAGGVGTGKTHLMCAWIRYLTLHRGIACRFIEFSHLLADIKAGYGAGKSDSEIIAHLVNVPVLVIDELGKQLNTDWQQGILDALISNRYERGRSTFFTTNFTSADVNRGPAEHWRGAGANLRGGAAALQDISRRSLDDVLGERIASRIAEMCDHLQLQGDDYRRNQAANALWSSHASVKGG